MIFCLSLLLKLCGILRSLCLSCISLFNTLEMNVLTNCKLICEIASRRSKLYSQTCRSTIQIFKTLYKAQPYLYMYYTGNQNIIHSTVILIDVYYPEFSLEFQIAQWKLTQHWSAKNYSTMASVHFIIKSAKIAPWYQIQ